MSDSTTPEDSWCLAYTKPKQENVAARNLERQSFEVYLPQFKILRNPGKGARSELEESSASSYEPLFPRYLFVRLTNENRNITTVRSTRGVSSLVVFGSQLALVAPPLLERIRELERKQHGEIHKETVAFRPGEGVYIEGTAFQGLAGIVQAVSAKRVLVLLELLGRPTAVKFRPQHLSLC